MAIFRKVKWDFYKSQIYPFVLRPSLTICISIAVLKETSQNYNLQKLYFDQVGVTQIDENGYTDTENNYNVIVNYKLQK